MHSIDRLKIAERLSAQRPASLAPLEVCVQVNVSGEASKSGVAPAATAALAQCSGAAAAAAAARPHGHPRADDRHGARAAPLRALRELQARPWSAAGCRSTRCRWGCPPISRRRSRKARRWCGSAPRSSGPRRERRSPRFCDNPRRAFRYQARPSAWTSNLHRRRQHGDGARRRARGEGFDARRMKVVEPLRRRARTPRRRAPASRASTTAARAAPYGDLVVLAVKPQQMREAARAVAPHLERRARAVDRRRHPARRSRALARRLRAPRALHAEHARP